MIFFTLVYESIKNVGELGSSSAEGEREAGVEGVEGVRGDNKRGEDREVEERGEIERERERGEGEGQGEESGGIMCGGR